MDKLTKYQLLLLLEKQKLGTLTEAEEEMLNHWFEQVPVIEELTFISEEEKNSIKSEISAAIHAKIKPVSSNVKKRNSRQWWRVSVAAALLVCCSLLAVYYFSINKNPANPLITLTTPEGITKMPVTLPDSSLVWLSAGSTISYPEKFTKNKRNTTLSGIAYFSIRPDKNAPFTVNTKNSIAVRVLGTSFVVDARKGERHINISVITGQVQVNEDKNKLDILVPGEKLFYSKQDRTFSKKQYTPEEMNIWKDNEVINLKGVSLDELSVLLHTMYLVNLNFDAQQTAHYRFNMRFSRTLPIDEVLNILHKTSGLAFERHGQEVRVEKQ